ncbi:hypothetical protein R3P38DRAFT_2814341 [Favolaschia claudopus]|uniref:Uncharacterized protein n=1 Tax=Favolaschia claudopus TaxID=2862362 RepID=A0AAV9Z3C5_9AGAR
MDVKVWDNSPAQMLSFGKETADQAIQQDNARVNNGIQQDIGELAAHSCPLERKGNHGQVKHKARNKAFDRHYKAIWLAGKSEGIEALSRSYGLNASGYSQSPALKAKHYKALMSWQGLGTSTSDCWNPE